MEQRFKTSALSLGTWAIGGWMWGGKDDEAQSIKAIHAAVANGVMGIDTAPIYGQGDSEIIVGKALQSLQRDQVQIMTKFGMRWDLSDGDFYMKSTNNNGQEIDVYKYAGKASIRYELEQSLKRLGTDYIDLYQIHWPESTTPIEETFAEVALLIQEGKIRYAGVCNYNVDQLERAMSVCPIVTNQVPYSMLNRNIEAELVPFCLMHEVGILAYSPMERGLLTGKVKPSTVFAAGDHRAGHKLFQTENIIQVNKFLDAIAPMAEKKNISISQLVLAWTMKRPAVLSALAGARNEEQAIANARAMMVSLEHEEMLYINKQLAIYFPL